MAQKVRDKMKHSFDVDWLNEYGFEKTAVLTFFCNWTYYNSLNNANFKKGRFWVYSTSEKMLEKMPYLKTSARIARILRELVNSGILIKDCLNENKWDRTAWFSISDEYAFLLDTYLKTKAEKSEDLNNALSKNETMHYSNLNNGIFKNKQSIVEKEIIENSNLNNDYNVNLHKENFINLNLGTSQKSEAQTTQNENVSQDFESDVLEKQTEAKKQKNTTMKKPTLDEIRAYISEMRYCVNAEAFFDYYESNGWKVGRASMKDWKAAVRTWQRHETEQRRRGDEQESKQERITRKNREMAARWLAQSKAETQNQEAIDIQILN